MRLPRDPVKDIPLKIQMSQISADPECGVLRVPRMRR